jgi:hypothetical protein
MIYPKSRVNVDGITVDESITSTFLLDEWDGEYLPEV